MTNRNQQMLDSKLGLGTWKMGSMSGDEAAEVAALQHGLDMGVTVIDTAEMYASGGAERVVGKAIKDRRENLYVVTKVLPSNASHRGTVLACERSLARLGTDVVDLFLLHWSGSHPLQETVNAFEELRERGLIKQWGVSNFDPADMQALFDLEHGENCAVNQVYYSMGARGIEFDLLPWQAEHDVAAMAYCPLDQGQLIHDERLRPIADKHAKTIAQIALAWIMTRPGVIPIPKSSSIQRTEDNVHSRDIVLDAEDMALIDQIFPPPTRAVPLKST